jgi:deferrochelatase/peroxidase EfeB
MIKDHIKVSKEEFLNNCAIDELLDEDEPLDEFIAADPDSYFAKSKWGDRDCYFVMTHGFEFIFI